MAAHEGRLNVLASNLANIGTTGFKRELATAHEQQLLRRLGPVSGVVNRSEVDFGQGTLQRTGRPLDLALNGDGFFVVEGPRGELFTREGAFHTTQDGVLVMSDGLPVAWEEQRGAIDTTGLPVVVDHEGNVRQGQFTIGRLRIVDFDDRSGLQRRADSYWEAPATLRQVTPTAVVHQGALEGSNANPMEELIAMITLQRSYEATSSAFSGLAETYQRLTRPF